MYIFILHCSFQMSIETLSLVPVPSLCSKWWAWKCLDKAAKNFKSPGVFWNILKDDEMSLFCFNNDNTKKKTQLLITGNKV